MKELLTMTAVYFLLISIVNVILSTVKSLCTVRYGRGIVILMNVLAYGFYTVVVKSVADLPLVVTVIGTVIANAIGVWLSYIILDKFEKDRLWKIEMSVRNENVENINNALGEANIPYNVVENQRWTTFQCYCSTRLESATVKEIGDKVDAKYSVFESKVL